MRYSEEEYKNFIYMMDQDTDIRCHKVSFGKVRKDHKCHLGLMQENPHIIKKGEFAQIETCLVDQEFWGSYYCCVPCMDKRLDEENGLWCCECQWYDYEDEENDEAFCLSEHSGYHITLVNYQHSCKEFKEMEEE